MNVGSGICIVYPSFGEAGLSVAYIKYCILDVTSTCLSGLMNLLRWCGEAIISAVRLVTAALCKFFGLIKINAK